jgi:hypothetical protein
MPTHSGVNRAVISAKDEQIPSYKSVWKVTPNTNVSQLHLASRTSQRNLPMERRRRRKASSQSLELSLVGGSFMLVHAETSSSLEYGGDVNIKGSGIFYAPFWKMLVN